MTRPLNPRIGQVKRPHYSTRSRYVSLNDPELCFLPERFVRAVGDLTLQQWSLDKAKSFVALPAGRGKAQPHESGSKRPDLLQVGIELTNTLNRIATEIERHLVAGEQLMRDIEAFCEEWCDDPKEGGRVG